ncbi:lipopolysaccharide assembly protein LapB [Plasticicumulans acidivorans]|uniref:Lipopolysaccharide assembly protein B n=1 Tax=Plasticicumulans acidivorans TaxID=886464 RepID=A0A317MS90_9GAMM|nr:lipopolysaccharide assembly protein LapB [Plasticicumulans acidivorans]PWV59494.1 lipopolysaccharide biosynthesis regulator YciM [Plasticicumulans acidivorans]
MFELLWLLLPVAAASGWLAATRRTERPDADSSSEDIYRGLNYLLDEKPDRAIEVFGRMVVHDPDAVEVQLTLGNLFRRRGEVDRALHIHSELLKRSQLTSEQRGRALLELGEDYLKSGLFDRAEALFEELQGYVEHRSVALVRLLSIFEQERDWRRALEISDKVEQQTGTPMRVNAAHYCCELASESLAAGRVEEALAGLEQALAYDPDSVRASIQRARVVAARGDYRQAIEDYLRVVRRAHEFLPEVLEPLRECYLESGRREDWLMLLRELVQRRHASAAAVAYAKALREQEGVAAALNFIERELRLYPSLEGLRQLIDLKLAAEEPVRIGDLETLYRIGHSFAERMPRYRCDNCGFVGKSLHWSCPSCKRWGTVRPAGERTRRD